MDRPFPNYRHTPLWAAVSGMLADLQASGEVRIDTAPEYVIGYICRELEAKAVIAAAALTPGD